ncbi:MAG: hypothetical protein BWK76_03100 [Desulfobulbaceae bacterium A2]|nr:MAG: hypothetical protein BWK76_03100 [Desulfobulbaceae bacterium A2]
MIRINLLPVREIKQRIKARNQVFMVLLGTLGVLLLLGGVALYQNQQVNTLSLKIKNLEAEKGRYTAIINKMKEIEGKKAILVKRIEVIEQLKKNTSLGVRILDEVAQHTPGDRVWLESLRHNDTTLQIKGVAIDNQTVARYMEALKSSPYFQGVELADSSLKLIEGQNLKAFSLNCSVKAP